LAAMVAAHLAGNVLAGEPPRQNWGKFEAHKWGGFNARSHGIHVQARLEDDAQCLLVIIGATPEGKKELVGLVDGVRERAQSWKELLLDLKRRGLAMGPELAVADGALGFWKALAEVWPKTREQRCWVHKTANILNRLPTSLQGKAKRALQNIWMAETRKDAEAAFDTFAEIYGTKYDKAVECLTHLRQLPDFL
jgi:putative transposase